MNKIFELLDFLILATQGGTKWMWDDNEDRYTYCGTNEEVTVRIKGRSNIELISLYVGPFYIDSKDFPILKEKLDLLYSEVKYRNGNGDNRTGLEELIEKVILNG